MSVTFQSDSFLADRGFSARWEAVYPHDIGGNEPFILAELDTYITHTCMHTLTHTYRNVLYSFAETLCKAGVRKI